MRFIVGCLLGLHSQNVVTLHMFFLNI
jgi:hypothetical protein